MYICFECDKVFEEPTEYKDAVGSWWGGETCYEAHSVCPFCGGEYEEAVECSECGEYCFEEDTVGGVCRKCIEKSITLEDAMEFIKAGDVEEFYEFLVEKKCA